MNMNRARITFYKLLQDSQDIGFDEDHMISRVFFRLDVAGKRYNDMIVDVKQPYGTDFESEPVEVFRPNGSYQGNWNQHAFSDAVESYYRSLVGSQGHGIRVAKGARMRNNTFVSERVEEFDIPD
jgi:hypothetical protein